MKFKEIIKYTIFVIFTNLIGFISFSTDCEALVKTNFENNLNPINKELYFLMDSSKPLIIKKSLIGNSTVISDLEGLYGTLKDNGDSYTYTLNSLLNGVEEFEISVNNENKILKIVPSYEITYDNDFFEIPNSKIDYNDRYLGHTSLVIHNEESTTSYQFDFCGTGIAIFGRTNALTGSFVTRIYEQDPDSLEYIAKSTAVIATKAIDTVDNFRQLLYSKNYENSNINKNLRFTLGKNNLLYIDGFIIYNPLGDNIEDDKIKELYNISKNKNSNYINFYINNSGNHDNLFYTKWFTMSPEFNHIPNSEIDSKVEFKTLEGKYGNLIYNNTGGDTYYKYEPKGWFIDVETFDVVIDGVPKILKFIPLDKIGYTPKVATSNFDIYIKSENMLLMSLSTNQIIFDDFSGVSDMLKDDALEISINSSLPYNLNAYLVTEIQNSDKSNTMDTEIFQLKEDSEIDYQYFRNINEKMVLKNNCEAGNNKVHLIDFKLKGGLAHEKDVYKTVVKFETEQI